MITSTKQRLKAIGSGRRKPVPVKRAVESVDDVLGRYACGSQEERFDLFLQYRGLRDEFSLLEKEERVG
jgi:hypothetical protein